MKIVDFILERLSEKSTWVGILSMLTAVGVTLSPDLSAAIGGAGLAIVGLLSAVLKEKGSA